MKASSFHIMQADTAALPLTDGQGGQRVVHPGHVLARLLAAAVLLLAAACAPVGPDYEPPAFSAPQSWHSELDQGLAARSPDTRQLAAWWRVFADPVLTNLVEEAIGGNLDIRQAMTRLHEARARLGLNRAAFFPSVDADGSVSRSRGSENTGSDETRTFYAAAFDAGWEVDIFGGVRRATEAAQAELAATRDNLRDVMVSLAAEVALTYLDLRTTQQRLKVAEQNLATQQQTYDLINWRYQAGLSNELALLQARYNLETTRARIPALLATLEEIKNRLAVLTGRIPGSVHHLLEAPAAIPDIPLSVAVGVPAETLRQRPDIREAERLLAAQTARIGAATADLYPRFRLAGSIGLEALEAGDLLTSAAAAWRIVPGVSWNIFDAGAIRRNIEVQSAIQERLLYAYETAVLDALAEVENTLTDYVREQVRRQHLAEAVQAADEAEKLALVQYEAGLTDFTTVLEAQRSLFVLEDQLAESTGTVTANLIRLYKALGGGWSAPAMENSPSKDSNP